MGNHRIIIVDEETKKFIEVIGAGKSGYKDGSFEDALFNQTFGTAYLDEKIYICDGKNHYIRCADLRSREVKTIAGTGNRGEDPHASNVNMLEQSLSSPFDITYDNDNHCFYIAMSGIHQIWKLDISLNTILPMVGSGVEGCHDDPLSLMHSTLAQPSGVSFGIGFDNKVELFIADSESSSIRAVNLTDLTSTRTSVGGDGTSTNLFCYGDKDGEGIEAKLQHPMGLKYIDQLHKIVVTDSYNQKIKLLDPIKNEIITIFGDGSSALKDGIGEEAHFMEPTDVCYKYDSFTDEITLYICDSSNDAIRQAVIYSSGNILTEPKVETILLKGVPSVVEVVKSNMVECGENGCRLIRPNKSKTNPTKIEQEPVNLEKTLA